MRGLGMAMLLIVAELAVLGTVAFVVVGAWRW